MLTVRQKEIIDASLKLIAEKGIQGLTIKNLAGSIGISEPAIYRHYDNKIQILIAILDYFRQKTGQIFEDEEKSNKNAIEKVEKIFSSHFALFAETPSLVAVIFSEEIFFNEAVLIERVKSIMEWNEQILLSILLKGQQEGKVRDDIAYENLSITIMGTLRLFIKRWQLSGYSFNLIREGETLIDAIKLLIVKNN